VRKTLTIAVPVYNEERVLPELLTRLQQVMTDIESSGLSATVLVIDDGSSDGTWSVIRNFKNEDQRFGYVRFSRNFGHQAAVSAACDFATTDGLVVMDGDLQDPPELIPKMVEIWAASEADVIFGQRESRDGNFLKRMCYAAFYRIFNAIVETKIPVDAGDFALMDRCAYEQLRNFPERVRFLRGLRSWIGFRQVALRYHRPDRLMGKPKYSFKTLYKLATDGVASFSVAPLKIAQFMAFLLFLATAGILVWSLRRQSISQLDPIFALDILLTFSMSILFLCVYILGAYISRMYLETKHRPLYIAADVAPGKSERTG